MYKPLLTADDIYKKEFKTGLRGYVIEDVDGYWIKSLKIMKDSNVRSNV